MNGRAFNYSAIAWRANQIKELPVFRVEGLGSTG